MTSPDCECEELALSIRFRRISRYITIVLALIKGTIIFPAVGSAQLTPFYEDWRYSQFTTSNGLPSNEIINLVETSDGIVWVMTTKGVAYYEGFHFFPVDHSLGLPNQSPSFISEGPNNKLLVIVDGILFLGDKQGFVPIPLPEQYSFGRFISAYTSKENSIIFNVRQTSSTAIFYFENGISKQLFVAQSLKLWKTISGTIWCNTNTQLYAIENNIPRMISIPGIEYFHIDRIIENSNGEGFLSVRIPSDKNVSYTWRNRNTIVKSNLGPAKTIRSAAISSIGEIFLVNEANELWLRDKGKWIYFPRITYQLMKLVFVQYRNNGEIWIGTGNGLFLFKRNKNIWKHSIEPNAAANNTVLEIFQTRQGDVWIGTAKGIEIRKNDGTVLTIHSIKNKPLGRISGINQDNEGNVWISSSSSFEGSYRWDGIEWKYFSEIDGLRKGYYHKIKKDRSGNLWFLGIGLSSPDPGAYSLVGTIFKQWSKKEGLFDNRVYSFANPKNGTLLFGTHRGLSTYSHNEWKYQTDTNTQNSSKIFLLAVDQKDNIWISHENASLLYYDPNDSLHVIWSEIFGIGERSKVWDIQCDENGTVWIATSNGLFCYTNGKIINYSSETGLQPKELRKILLTNTNIYVGGEGSGLHILDKNDISAPILIEFQQHVEEWDNIQIKWRVYSYWETINSDDIETRYRINDSEWSEWNGKTEVVYSNLKGGIHHFTVQARNPFGISTITNKKIFLTAQSPFYRLPTIIIASTTLLVVIAVFGIRYFVLSNKYHLEFEKSRKRIASDLHDDIGSNLGTIALMSQRHLRSKKIDAALKEDLSVISQLSIETAEYLRDIVWYTNPKHDTHDDLVLRLKETAGIMLRDYDIYLHVEGDAKDFNSRIEIRRNVLLIFKEILHNIIKHSKASHVEFILFKNKSTFGFTILEDGIGFDIKTIQRGNGLNNIEMRAKEVNAKVDINGIPGLGSKIMVTFQNHVNT